MTEKDTSALYGYLSNHGITQLDSSAFYDKYSNPENGAKLYAMLQGANGKTYDQAQGALDFDDFLSGIDNAAQFNQAYFNGQAQKKNLDPINLDAVARITGLPVDAGSSASAISPTGPSESPTVDPATYPLGYQPPGPFIMGEGSGTPEGVSFEENTQFPRYERSPGRLQARQDATRVDPSNLLDIGNDLDIPEPTPPTSWMTQNYPEIGYWTDRSGWLGRIVNDTFQAISQGGRERDVLLEAHNLLSKGTEISDEELSEYIMKAARMQEMGPSEDMMRVHRAYEEYGADNYAAMRALLENPDAWGEVFISSLTASANEVSLLEGAKVLGGSTLLGMGVGGGLGSPGGAPGVAIGMGTGGEVGFYNGLNMAMAEMGGILEQYLSLGMYIQDEIDAKALAYNKDRDPDLPEMMTDFSQDNVRMVLDDEEAWGRVVGRSLARKDAIAITEYIGGALSLAVGGRMLTRGMSRLKTGLTVTGIESGTGYVGEAAAQIYAEEDRDPLERGLEAVGSIPMGFINTGISSARVGKFYMDDNEVTRGMMTGFLNTADYNAIAEVELKATRDRYMQALIQRKKFEAAIDPYIPSYITGDTRMQVMDLEVKRQGLLVQKNEKGKLRKRDEEALIKLDEQINTLMETAFTEFSYVEDEQVDLSQVKPIRGPYRVTELLNRPVQLLWFGNQDFDKPISGVLFQEGQRVIFEDLSGTKQWDLGNRTMLERTLAQGQAGVQNVQFRGEESFGNGFGLAHDSGVVSTNSAGSIMVEGKPFEMVGFQGVPQSTLKTLAIEDELAPIYPEILDEDGNVTDLGPLVMNKGVFYDESGNVMAVAMYNVLDRKMETFTGQTAEDLAYQILLRELQSPEQIQKVNEAIGRDARFREAFEEHQRRRAQVTPTRSTLESSDATQSAQEGADTTIEEIPERSQRAKPTEEQARDNVFIRDQSTYVARLNSLGQLFMRRQFTSKRALPQSMFDYDEARLAGMARMSKQMELHMRDMEKIMKDIDPADVDLVLRDYDAALRGDIDAEEALPPKLRAHVNVSRAVVDGMSTRLIMTGAIDDVTALSVEENLGSYLNRSYRAFNDPKWASNWQTELGRDEVTRVRGFLRRQLSHSDAVRERMKEFGETYADAMENLIDHEIATLLQKDNWELDALGRAKYQFGKNLGITRERQDIPEPIRTLLGERTDPMYNWHNTVAKQANLVFNHEYQEAIRNAGMGVYFFEKGKQVAGQEKIFNVEIARKGSGAYEPLAGLYTSKEIAEELSMKNMEAYGNKLFQLIGRISGLTKWVNTIGSVGTQIRNFEGNVGFMARNGHFDVTQMGTAYNATFKSLQEDLAKLDNNSWRERYLRYVELGLVGQNTVLGDVRGTMTKGGFEQMAEERLRMRPQDRIQKLGRGVTKAKQSAEAVYGGTDDFFKIYAFENDLRRYSKALFDKPYNELSPENLVYLEDYVSKIVRNTYPTYSRVPLAVKAAGANPLFADFVSFESEAYRTYYNQMELMISELTSDNPRLRKIGAQRLAGMTAYSSFKNTMYSQVGLGYGGLGLLSLTKTEDEREEEAQFRNDVAWALPTYTLSANETLNESFFFSVAAPYLFPTMYTEQQERERNSYMAEKLVFLESEPGHVRFLQTSQVDPYAGTDRVFQSLMGGLRGESNIYSNNPVVEGALRSLAEVTRPFISPSIFISATDKLLMSRETAQIYNPEDPAEKQRADVLSFMYKELFATGTEKQFFNIFDVEYDEFGNLRRKSLTSKDIEERLLQQVGAKVVDINLHDAFRTSLYTLAKRRGFAYRQRGEKDVPIGEAAAAAEESYEDILFAAADLYFKCIRMGCEPGILDLRVKEALGFEPDSEDWVLAKAKMREGLTLGRRDQLPTDVD